MALPPLNALRAFEATARHLSVTRAARELFVTPAAVSHQIKALEEALEASLFVRGHRSLKLTEDGAALLPGLQAGFAQLNEAVRQVHARRQSGVLTVSASLSFSSKWLIPRLDQFRQQHPDIGIRFDASDEMANFRDDGVDIAVRFGSGNYPGLASHVLWDTNIYPVCSPSLPTSERPLDKPEDLRHHTLLHTDWFSETTTWWDWRSWLRTVGLHDIDPNTGLQFNQTSLALQAAIDGQGVALVSGLLVRDDVAAGRLIKPLDVPLYSDFTYYLVYPEERAEEPRISAFRDWLLAALAAT